KAARRRESPFLIICDDRSALQEHPLLAEPDIPVVYEMIQVEPRYTGQHDDTGEIMATDGPVWVNLHRRVPVLLREVDKIAEVRRTAAEADEEFMKIQRIPAGTGLEVSHRVSALAG